jgi:hypothetical protein
MVATNAITTNASRDAVERKISQAMHANSSEQGS